MANKRTRRGTTVTEPKNLNEVNEEANVADIETSPEEVVVNENRDGEATNGTTKDGDKSEVKNTDKIPQNGVTEIETLDVTDNEIAKEADAARTEEEIRFSDESNPNQKGRNAAAPEKYDQDGNLRTDGYSYGVAPDDVTGLSEDAVKENAGQEPEDVEEDRMSNPVFTSQKAQTETINTEDPNVEREEEDVEKLEEELSRPDKGIIARVTSATAGYFRIKFFKNNKPLATYKARTRELDTGEVNEFLDRHDS